MTLASCRALNVHRCFQQSFEGGRLSFRFQSPADGQCRSVAGGNAATGALRAGEPHVGSPSEYNHPAQLPEELETLRT